MRSKLDLIWSFLACILLPLLAAWFAYPVDHLPPKFGVFLPCQIPGVPAFNLIVFCLILFVCVVITALLLFPQLFGFKSAPPVSAVPATKFPVWFWIVWVFFIWAGKVFGFDSDLSGEEN